MYNKFSNRPKRKASTRDKRWPLKKKISMPATKCGIKELYLL